jgi:prophage regulatory protein
MAKQYTTQNAPVTPIFGDTSDDTAQAPKNNTARYLPSQGMSRASQLLPFLPFGTTTLWAWSRDGRFPAPVKLSPTMTAWRNADVIEWLNSQTPSINEGV